MHAIHQQRSRIRRGRGWGRGRFVIGHYDRMADATKRMPLSCIAFDPAYHFGCPVADAEGEVHWMPLHRIRAVFRAGALIWLRPPTPGR